LISAALGAIEGGFGLLHGSPVFPRAGLGAGLRGFASFFGAGDSGLGSGIGLPRGSLGRPDGARANAPPVSTCTVPSSTRSNRNLAELGVFVLAATELVGERRELDAGGDDAGQAVDDGLSIKRSHE
jgi:hypothetical protein